MRGAGGEGHGTAVVAAPSCVGTVSAGTADSKTDDAAAAGAALDDDDDDEAAAAALVSDSAEPAAAVLFVLFCPGQSSSDCL